MVYRTRGSPGCLSCRTRRIKCNLLKPRCSQCARAGFQCSGYRSQWEIQFRDESKAVIQKSDSDNPAKEPQGTAVSAPRPSPSTPVVWIEESAQMIFQDNFSIMKGTCGSTVDFATGEPDPASLSGTSVGLAALAVIRKDPRTMYLARQKYSSALQLLAKAVQNPIHADTAKAIAAGFVLSMFEVIVSERSVPSNLWVQHSYGTAVLLNSLCAQIRVPKDQARSLLDVSFTSALAALMSRKPVPQMFLRLADDIELESDDFVLLAVRLCSHMSSIVNLYLSAKEASQDSQDRLLFQAFASNQALEAWATALPSAWAYQTGQNPLHYAYGSSWFARMWHYYRLSRILAYQTIIHILDNKTSTDQTPSHSVDGDKAHKEQATSLIDKLVEEIDGSLPNMFDLSGANPTAMPLSLDVFFATAILQSLVEITGKTTFLRSWPSPTCTLAEEKSAVIAEILKRNLNKGD